MDTRSIIMGVGFALIWASAFTSTRIIVAEAAPLHMLALRFAVSGVIAMAMARAMGARFASVSRAQWRPIIILGLCQNALYLGLNWVGMQWVEAGLAAIIAATMPLLVAMIGWARGEDRLTGMGIAGLLAGLAGVALIMQTRISGGSDPWGVTLCMFGAVALAVATLSLRGAAGGVQSLGALMQIVGLQMLVGALALGLVAPFIETWHVNATPELGLALLYTIFVPGLAATLLWFSLIGRIGAVRAAVFHFLSPFFGVLMGALVLGEKIGPRDALGVAVVAAGILMVQISRLPPAR